MKSYTPVPGLARLLFRAHNELNALLGELPLAAQPAAHPLLNLRVGAMHFALGAQRQGSASIQTLDCADGNHRYQVTLRSPDGRQQASLNARLTNLTTGASHELSGERLLKNDVPDGFEKLHSEVMAQLKQWLPEKLLHQLQGGASQTSEPPAEQQVAKTEGVSQDETQPTPEEVPQEQWTQYVIVREGEPDLRFHGKLVDAVRSSPYRGRWTEMRVYQTKGGKYVGVKLGCSMWLNETDRAHAQVAGTLEELAGFFGDSLLAKALTRRLGVQPFVDVD